MTLKPGDIVELADGTVIGPIKEWYPKGWFYKDGYKWKADGRCFIRRCGWENPDERYDVVAVVTVTRKKGEG